MNPNFRYFVFLALTFAAHWNFTGPLRVSLVRLLGPYSFAFCLAMSFWQMGCFYALFYFVYKIDTSEARSDKQPGFFRYLAHGKQASSYIFLFIGITAVLMLGQIMDFGQGFGLMVPTIVPGDKGYFSGVPYAFDSPKRGEIVATVSHNSVTRWIFRVVGLPGEKLTCSSEATGRTISVNSRPLAELYRAPVAKRVGTNAVPIGDPALFLLLDTRSNVNTLIKLKEITLSRDQFLLLADERSGTNGFGLIAPRNEIVGKLFIRIWPLKRMGILPDADFKLVEASPRQAK